LSLKRPCKYYFGQLGSWSDPFLPSFPKLFMRASVVCLAAVLQHSVLCSVCFPANSPMPGEERSGVFYAITHFSWFAYGILFLVFCLSLINLLLQLRISRGWNWPVRIFGPIYPQGLMIRHGAHTSGKLGRRHTSNNPDIHKINANPLDDGIVAIRTLSKDGGQTVLFPPTPLDGTNHRLPNFESVSDQRPDDSKLAEKDNSKISVTKEFRFSSAVDVPSQEELERREKERLVVSGSVIGPDGAPVESAVVYLTDVDGNKIGQSCRSSAENGFFKVLVQEAGSYLLHGYKRGFVMIGDRPIPIPVESGKIDGLVINLEPQGRLIQGRAILEDGAVPLPNIQVKCLCKNEGFVGTSSTDEVGYFRLSNVPINSECYLEAVDSSGNILAKTEIFETVQKKQLYKDIKIPMVQVDPGIGSSEVFNPFIESKEEDGRNDAAVTASGI
jgi:hypothetical protein